MGWMDNDAVRYMWSKIVAKFVRKESGKGLSTNDYTTAEKNKLGGIEAGANKYVHDSFTARESGLYKITVNDEGHIIAVSAVAKSDITGLGIPSQDTNTHYESKNITAGSPTATVQTNAALTNGNVYLIEIENGAVKSSHKISGAGSVAVTTDASGNIVITGQNTTYSDMKGATASAAGARGLVPAPAAGKQSQYLRGDGTWATPTNTTYSDATQSAHGLMSAPDKKKLDGIEAGAEVNQNAFSSIQIGMHIKNAGPNGDMELVNTLAGTNASYESSDLFFNFIDGEIPFEAVIEDSEQPLEPGEIRLKARLARPGVMGFMSGDDCEKLNALPTNTALAATYAKKSDITGMYKYKGSVAAAANLPTSGQVTGDVYNIESSSIYGGAGMNVAWNGTKWDPLGEIFTITPITNAEIDAICV